LASLSENGCFKPILTLKFSQFIINPPLFKPTLVKVIFIKNRKAGPYTIKHLDKSYLLVSHHGTFINSDWVTDSEESCINQVKLLFGADNVEVKTYKKNHEGLWAIYEFITKPMFTAKIRSYRSFEFTGIFGFGHKKIDFSNVGNEGCVLHEIYLPFCKLSFGQYKHYAFC
jgi:hypothetical protein